MAFRFGLIIVLSAALPSVAAAGVRYKMENRELPDGPAYESEMLAQDGMLRIKADQTTEVIFRPDEDVMMVVDHEREEIQTVTREQLEQAGQMMSGLAGGGMPEGMAKQMQEAMKDLPPEARAKAEAMMKQMGQGKGPGGMGMMQQPAAPEVTATGQSDEVAGIDCEIYSVTRNGVREQEMCLAKPGDVTGGAELMEALNGMSDFLSGITGQLPGGGSIAATLRAIDGRVPVMSRDFEGGKAVAESGFSEAEEVDLDASAFDPPSGYRQSMGMGMN